MVYKRIYVSLKNKEFQMRIKIKKVIPDTTIEGKVWIYWIYAELNSGKIIRLFDDIPFNLENYINASIEVFVETGFYKVIDDIPNLPLSKNKTILKGKYIGNYELSTKWRKANWIYEDTYEFYKKNKPNGFQTEDGIFHLSGGIEKIKKKGIKLDMDTILEVGRIDLTGWYPIEE
jgi:hypothetical protein